MAVNVLINNNIQKFIYSYAAALPQITSTILKKLIKTFKFSDFNKEPTNSLNMI